MPERLPKTPQQLLDGLEQAITDEYNEQNSAARVREQFEEIYASFYNKLRDPFPEAGAVPTPVRFTDQASVTVAHNLGRYVQAQVYDQDGALVEGALTHLDLNTIELQFSQPLTGTVVLR